MPNRLATEKSPYLRQHADNPVDWLPWGAEALARAAAEGKPVFLSIGYASCHWCHVMAHESFADAGIAEILNREFVPVKVDREERPDIDRVYMTYVQQTTGHGGWPLSVWLTPQGHPFHGGTYFPPTDRHGRPGFGTLLTAIARHWRENRAAVEQGAGEVVAVLSRLAAEVPAEATSGDEMTRLAEAAGAAFETGFGYFHESYDADWGGFGGAPKFPRASALDFLFRVAALQGTTSEVGKAAVEMATRTLQRMTEGGLHDHVGGGYHRYSVDGRWHVPHFEKMLYDQAQIALNFLDARQVTGREVFAWQARDIFDYVRRDLTAPGGAFYSSEDADSLAAGPEGKPHSREGAFYVWTRDEIVAALGADADFFCAHFGVQAGSNVAEDAHGEFAGQNVLMQQQSLAATARAAGLDLEAANAKLQDCLEKLRAIRARRPRPGLDDKIITAWNGLMISALAKGARGLADPALLASAERAAEFLHRELYDAGTQELYRSWCEGRSNIPAFAEDYAFLIQGLLDLYEAGFELRWLKWAMELQGAMDRQFWDDQRGGYFNSRAGDATVIVRLKEDYDGAEPAPNSVAAANLFRLDWMIGLAGAAGKGRKTIEALRPQWTRAPQALPEMMCALELALSAPRTVVLAGEPSSPAFRAMAAILAEGVGPRRALLAADGGKGQAMLAQAKPYLAEMTFAPGSCTAYVCENYACAAPVTDPAALRHILRENG